MDSAAIFVFVPSVVDPAPGSGAFLIPEAVMGSNSEILVTIFGVKNTLILCQLSVADPDPGSGTFLTPGSGIREEKKIRIWGSLINISDPQHY